MAENLLPYTPKSFEMESAINLLSDNLPKYWPSLATKNDSPLQILSFSSLIFIIIHIINKNAQFAYISILDRLHIPLLSNKFP